VRTDEEASLNEREELRKDLRKKNQFRKGVLKGFNLELR